jgi:hypothetical protein
LAFFESRVLSQQTCGLRIVFGKHICDLVT